MFEGVFPDQAGRIRWVEVTFRQHRVPHPGQIAYRLDDIVRQAKSLIARARAARNLVERTELVFSTAARIHADCVIVQPFIDGNKRWARLVLSALVVDCGFPPGVIISSEDKRYYLEAIDKAVSGDETQLAHLIAMGWRAFDDIFRSGRYSKPPIV
jgi:fido (protein-threonine AMPylation protein)